MPTTKKKSGKKSYTYTEEQRRETNERKAQAVRDAEAIKEKLESKDSVTMEDFNAMVSRLPKEYSQKNLLLIFAQCPHASQLQAFPGWSAMGYKIKTGSKKIWIRAPHERKDEDGDTIMDAEGNDKVGCHLIGLFDLSQVEPMPEKKPKETILLP